MTSGRERMQISLFLMCLCLVVGCQHQGAGADCNGVLCPPHGPHQPCQGSLILRSDNERKTFPYDGSQLNCHTENLRLRFRFSRAEVSGCGSFFIYNKKDRGGQSAAIRKRLKNISWKQFLDYSWTIPRLFPDYS